MEKKNYSTPELTKKILAFLETVKRYGCKSSYIGMSEYEEVYTKQQRYASEMERFKEIVKTIHENDPVSYRTWYDVFKDDRQYHYCQAFYTDAETGIGYQLYRKAPTYKYEKPCYSVHVYKPATIDMKIEVMQRRIEKIKRDISSREERMKRMRGRIIEDMKAENNCQRMELQDVLAELCALQDEKQLQAA